LEIENLSQIAVSSIVSSAGLLVQTVNALLILLLLYLLRKTHLHRDYVKYWVFSWGLLVLSLLSISLYYFLPQTWINSSSSALINACYLCFKLFHYLFLLVGMVYYARERPSQSRVIKSTKLASITFVLLFICQLFLQFSTNKMVLIQTPAAIFVFFYSALMLNHSANASPTSLGITFTRKVLYLSAILWVFYALFFPYQAKPSVSLIGGEWANITSFNSYYDLIVQMLLAFGQVMLIMQHNHSDLSKAHKALKNQSLTDHLTGSFNRQALHEHNRKIDIDKGASVIVCDLDNLKAINDKHGHAEGDRLLRQFVAEVEKRLRSTDSVYRWGGDEFIIVLNESTPEEADAKIFDLQKTILPLILPNGEQSIIEFSYGISYSRRGDKIEDAISSADRRMYQQKESKRISTSL